MNKLTLKIVLGLLGVGVGYFVLNHTSAPEVNANLSPAQLDEAMVVSMGSLLWETDPDAAYTRAAQTGKPVLMLFTAEWCGPCRTLHAGPLDNSEVQQAISDHFVPLYMDVTEPGDSPAQKMSTAYKVKTIPRLVVTSPKGKTLAHDPGSMDTANLLRWIDQNK